LIAGDVPESIKETKMTTKLRREMDNAMVLRGFSPRTRECYLACVTALARHYHRSPASLDAAEIQSYLLHLIKDKKLAYASVNQAVCAFRFLFDAVLGHQKLALEIPMAKVPKRLPQVLSREEVTRLFAAAASLRARTVLMTTYAAGLRVSELLLAAEQFRGKMAARMRLYGCKRPTATLTAIRQHMAPSTASRVRYAGLAPALDPVTGQKADCP